MRKQKVPLPVPAQPLVQGAGEEVRDETGIAVPDKALAVWNRRHEIDPFLDTIEDLKRDIEAAAGAKGTCCCLRK